MFENFGSVLVAVVVLLSGVMIYAFRGRLKALFIGGKEEKQAEFIQRLISRAQKIKWSPEWPKVLEVYVIFQRLSANQQNSSAALGGALKHSFVSLSRDDANKIARCFMRSVRDEAKRESLKANNVKQAGKIMPKT